MPAGMSISGGNDKKADEQSDSEEGSNNGIENPFNLIASKRML